MAFTPIGTFNRDVIQGDRGAWLRQPEGGYLFERSGTLTREADLRSSNYVEDGEGWILKGNGDVQLPSDFQLLGSAEADGTSIALSVTSIPATHRALLVHFHGSTAGSVLRTLRLRLNNDSSAGAYRYVLSRTDDNAVPTNVASNSATEIVLGVIGDDAFLSGARIDIPNYSAALNHTVLFQSGGTQGTAAGNSRTNAGWGVHVSAAAVTQVNLLSTTDNLSSGSTLRVYGLGLI